MATGKRTTMPSVTSGDRLAEASALLADCAADSLEVREGAIFAADGRQLFATDGGSWAEPVAALWRLAGSPGRDVAYIHVGTESGEVLAVRAAHGSAAITADRFPLAALVLNDLRAVLRELDPGSG